MNMRLIERYIVVQMLLGVAPVLLILLGLFSFLSLTEELEDVGKGSFSTIDALIVTALSLPSRLLELAPVSALLGTLVGLGAMANHHELTAIRASGRSPWRIASPIMVVAVLAGAALLLLQTLVTPVLESEIARRHANILTDSGERRDGHIWLRTDQHYIRVASADGGRVLSGIEIYSLTDQSNIASVRLAETALVLEDGSWLLQEVSESRLDQPASAQLYSKSDIWVNALSSDQTAILTAPVESLSLLELWRFIDTLHANGLGAHRYRVQLWQQLGVPISLLAMSLLGLPFVLGSLRSVPIARRIAAGGGVGIAVYLVEQLSIHSAVLFELNPVVSSLLPESLILLIALWLISKAEGHDQLRKRIRRFYSTSA